MAINVIELTGNDLVEGLAAGIGSISFQQLVEKFGIARANQLWAENTVDNLYLDFGGSIGETVGHAGVGVTYVSSGGSPASTSSTTMSALELAQSTEMAATDVNMMTIGQGAMQTGANTAQLTPLGSIDIGSAAAAISVALGICYLVELYDNNPEFWTKLSQKLLPFCWPGTTEIPTWLDIVETAQQGVYETHVVIDYGAVEAVKEFYEENGYNGFPSTESDLNTGIWTQPIPTVEYPCSIKFPVYPAYDSTDNVYHTDKYQIVQFFPNEHRKLISIAVRDGNKIRIVPVIVKDRTGQVFQSDCTEWVTTYRVSDNSFVGIDDEVRAFFSTDALSYTYNNKTVYYWPIGFSQSSPNVNFEYAPLSSIVNAFTNVILRPDVDFTYDGMGEAAWTAFYSTTEEEVPEGTESWTGYTPSIFRYNKDIIYIVEDPSHIGTYIPQTRTGVEIAINSKESKPPQADPLTKPENWPEHEPWPTQITFPWKEPDDYEGEWPSTMPWPLPPDKPDWWPESIPYPSTMPMPGVSISPDDNPDPNTNEDPVIGAKYVNESYPGLITNPLDEPVPDPDEDPSRPPSKPSTTLDDPDDIRKPDSKGKTPTPPLPDIPTPFGIDSDPNPYGVITVYHPTAQQLRDFSRWLWVTYADPSIDKLWNNPFDGVISLMELYCTPTDIGVKSIRSGFLDSGISSQTISRYTELNCGSLTVPEFYGNYLDYSPYSKCHMYLPFIGIVELNVDDIVGHAVNITYRIDEYNGSCIAMITVAKSTVVNGQDVEYSNTMYQFSGNCGVDLPFAGGSQSSIRAGMMQAAAYGLSSVIGGVVSGVSGNIGGAISQIGYGAANAIGSVVSAKSSVQHSGSFGASYGAMGIKTPYIVVTRPKQLGIPNYTQLYGYPAHKMVTIGACSGYIRVREVNVRSSTATDDEKKKIEELLKEGVYLN